MLIFILAIYRRPKNSWLIFINADFQMFCFQKQYKIFRELFFRHVYGAFVPLPLKENVVLHVSSCGQEILLLCSVSCFIEVWILLNYSVSPFLQDTPSQRVQFILGTEDDDEHIPHDLFTEMDELCFRDGEEYEWRETARYVWSRLFQDITYSNFFKKNCKPGLA